MILLKISLLFIYFCHSFFPFPVFYLSFKMISIIKKIYMHWDKCHHPLDFKILTTPLPPQQIIIFEMLGVLTNIFVVIILEYIHQSNHYTVHHKYTQCYMLIIFQYSLREKPQKPTTGKSSINLQKKTVLMTLVSMWWN